MTAGAEGESSSLDGRWVMAQRSSSRRRERRRIVCRADGSMFDPAARHSISVEELRDHLLDGGLFEAETEETGRDCTYEVLRRVMGTPGLDAFTGGGSGAPGGLPGVGALGGLSQLAGLAKVFGDVSSHLDRDDRDDRTSSRARSRARHRVGRDEFRAESDGPTDNEGEAG